MPTNLNSLKLMNPEIFTNTEKISSNINLTLLWGIDFIYSCFERSHI